VSYPGTWTAQSVLWLFFPSDITRVFKLDGVDNVGTATRLALALLLGAYLLQLISPLRLDTDVIAYLSKAASAADGQGFVFKGPHSVLPLGYPVVLAGMDRMGLGAAWAFMALNILFLCFGLAASYLLLRRTFGLTDRVAAFLCGLTLLCYLFVKHVSLLKSDIPFFGLMMACLLVLSWTEAREDGRRWYGAGAALLLGIAALSIRTVGIALLPAFLWACLPPGRRSWRPFTPDWKPSSRTMLPVVIGICLLVAGVAVLIRTPYLDLLTAHYEKWGGLNALSYIFGFKMKEWGQLVVNVPASMVPGALTRALPFVGFLGFGLFLVGLWQRRSAFGAAEVFILGYVVILFLWPGYAARLWLPVIPLLMGWIALVLRPFARRAVLRRVMQVYLVWFVIAGCAALVYSSRITLAGAAFPDRYGDGTLSPTYRAAFTGREDIEGVDEEALELLIRYERRVHPRFKRATLVPF